MIGGDSWIGLPQVGGFIALILIAVAVEILRRTARARRISHRLFAEASEANPDDLEGALGEGGLRSRPIALWLQRAGHRAAAAESTFVASMAACLLLAGAVVLGVRASGITEEVAGLFAALPVVGAGLGSLALLSPWIFGLGIAGLPIALVRRDRARRVEEIEQDLPLALELLATLAEAGLGFESAVAEWLHAQPIGRPLADELRLYQLEVSAGARRAESLRRLDSRVDLPVVSAFASALIHGEDTGSSIAGLLRPQASLVRQRRREQALAVAESLPEKLVVPLLIGFLPGLMVWTLGPAFFQVFEMIDAAFG